MCEPKSFTPKKELPGWREERKRERERERVAYIQVSLIPLTPPRPPAPIPPQTYSLLNGRYVSKGCWDSIHVVEVNEAESGKEATYKLTTTVMLSMSVDKAKLGNCNLAGSLSRQAKETAKFDKFDTHLTNVGQMIEKMETSLRKNLDGLYVS
jgi:hypothetical protein